MHKMKELFEKYGQLALVLHLLMYAVTFAVMFCVIHFGFRETIIELLVSWIGDEYVQAGTWVVVFAATKATQPLRIMLLFVCVPWLHRYLEQRKSYSDTVA